MKPWSPFANRAYEGGKLITHSSILQVARPNHVLKVYELGTYANRVAVDKRKRRELPARARRPPPATRDAGSRPR